MAKCPKCGATNCEQVGPNKFECPYCGTSFNEAPAQPQYQQAPPQPQYQQAPPQYQQAPPQYQQAPRRHRHSDKSKTVAGLLGILLGGLGAHKFYMGQTGMGILYLLLCWTYIPEIVGFIEGIIYLCGTDEEFWNKCE